jgi:hypothetical protein
MPRLFSKLTLLILTLAPVIAQAQTETTLWRFVQPNAKALISIDWSHIRKSHIGTMLREKFVDGNPDASVPGAEFLDDADRFVISSPGQNPDDPTAEAPMLIAVSGHFDLAKVRTVLARHGAKPQKFNSWQVYRPQGKDAKDLAFVLLDAQTILIGDSRSIFASLERSAFPAPAPEADSVLARAADMDANYDFWAIIPGTDALVGDRLSALISGHEMGSEAKSFEIGVSLRNGLTADVSLGFENETDAKTMSSELSKIVKLAAKDNLGEPAVRDLEKRLKFTAQGALAKLSLRMTPQELEKNAQIFEASHKHPAASVAEIRPAVKQESATPKPAADKPEAATPKLAAAKPEPPPKPKMVIRIEGLDDGPREIPYQEKQ